MRDLNSIQFKTVYSTYLHRQTKKVQRYKWYKLQSSDSNIKSSISICTSCHVTQIDDGDGPEETA